MDETQVGEFIPKYNGYRCMNCGKIFATVELDPGVTPMFMTCMMDEECGGRAHSLMYPDGTPPLGMPVLFEFYKPSEKEFEKIKHPALKEHVARGGLMRRATDAAPDWVKRLA